jgi:hypothetical protein
MLVLTANHTPNRKYKIRKNFPFGYRVSFATLCGLIVAQTSRPVRRAQLAAPNSMMTMCPNRDSS